MTHPLRRLLDTSLKKRIDELGTSQRREDSFQHEYDPVKAHEYYMRTRELKGRPTGQTQIDLPKVNARRPDHHYIDTIEPQTEVKTSPGEASLTPAQIKGMENREKIRQLKETLKQLREELKELVRLAKARSGVVDPPKEEKDDRPEEESEERKLTPQEKKEAAERAKEAREKEKGTYDKEIETLSKQIEEVRKKIAKAKEKLAKASMKKNEDRLQNRGNDVIRQKSASAVTARVTGRRL